MKLLIVSNNAFNNTSSNGRTLGRLLTGIPLEDKMQFCVNGTSISSDLITESYQITDKMMLNGLLRKKIMANRLCENESQQIIKDNESANYKQKIGRTPFSMLIRELIWKSGYHKTNLLSLAESFQPDIIVYQMGDNAFLIDLVLEIAKKTKSKIVTYTTEDYYFKEWNYLRKSDKKDILYSIFHYIYKKSLVKLLEESSLLIANTPLLANIYKNKFGVRTECVMASAADFDLIENYKVNQNAIYAGNLGVGRHETLIKIADSLKKWGIKLEVYGKANLEIEDVFKSNSNIEMHGFISYEELKAKIKSAYLVIHAESFDSYYLKDCKMAFSSKIADCLACGVPLLLVAPDEMAVTKYLMDNRAAFICDSISNLDNVIDKAINDKVQRENVIINAKKLAINNHVQESNADMVMGLLSSI